MSTVFSTWCKKEQFSLGLLFLVFFFDRTTLKFWDTASACCRLSSPAPPDSPWSSEQCVTSGAAHVPHGFSWIRQWHRLFNFSTEDTSWPTLASSADCCPRWRLPSTPAPSSSGTTSSAFFWRSCRGLCQPRAAAPWTSSYPCLLPRHSSLGRLLWPRNQSFSSIFWTHSLIYWPFTPHGQILFIHWLKRRNRLRLTSFSPGTEESSDSDFGSVTKAQTEEHANLTAPRRVGFMISVWSCVQWQHCLTTQTLCYLKAKSVHKLTELSPYMDVSVQPARKVSERSVPQSSGTAAVSICFMHVSDQPSWRDV